MKRLSTIILIVAFCNLNVVSANDYYNYLRSDDTEIVQPQKSDIRASENNNYIEIVGSDQKVYTFDDDEYFQKNNTQPYVVSISSVNAAYSNQSNPTVTNKTIEEDDRTFFEKHPVLAAIGTGLLVIAVTGTAIALECAVSDYDKQHHTCSCKGHRPPHSNHNTYCR